MLSGSKLSTFLNDINFISSGSSISALNNDSGYALTGQKTNVSQSINDPPYATTAQLKAATASSTGPNIQFGYAGLPSSEIQPSTQVACSTVTFPKAFGSTPVVVGTSNAPYFIVSTSYVTATTVSLVVFNASNTQSYCIFVQYIAIASS